MFELETVVVADASAVVRQLFEVCFVRVATSVRQAADADEAFAQLAGLEGRILLVADAELPPSGALALYERCAALSSHVELILTARRIDAQLVERARAAGALHVFAKPVKFRELLQLLRERAGVPRVARRVRPGELAYVLALEPDAHTAIARWDVHDISTSGALLATHGALRIGSELSLDVVIAGRHLPVHAQVVRVQPPSCTAVRFLGSTTQMQVALDELEARILGG
jgi:CheY-like chemotaxis protein